MARQYDQRKKKEPHARSRSTGEAKSSVKQRRLSGEERRQQILEAAQRVFIRSGFRGARTKEIADEAGINEAIVFKHFASKEELFDSSIVEPLEDVVEEEILLAKTYSHASGPDEERRINMEADRRFFETVNEIYPLMMTALFSDREKGFQFYQDHFYPWLQTLTEVQRPAFKGRKRKNIKPEIIAMIGVGAYMMIMMDSYFRHKAVDVDGIISNVSDIFNTGLFED